MGVTPPPSARPYAFVRILGLLNTHFLGLFYAHFFLADRKKAVLVFDDFPKMSGPKIDGANKSLLGFGPKIKSVSENPN